MPWTPTLANTALDAALVDCGYVAGWSTTPAEVTSRETVSWEAAADGASYATNQPVLTVAGACLINRVYLFPTSTGGAAAAKAMCLLSPASTFTEAGTYTLTEMVMLIDYTG